MKAIFDGYRGFLASLGCFDKDDLLYYADGKPVEFTYNKVKRQLALPTDALIKKGMVDLTGAEVHPFHPLCEDVLRGESGTIRYLKREIRANYIQQSLMLISEIIRIKIEKITPRSSYFTKWMSKHLGDLKDIPWDAKLKKSFDKAIEELLADPKDTCNIYITNKTKIEGDMFLRVANVTTILDQLGEEGVDFFSSKLERKIDKVVIVRLLNAVFEWMPHETGSNDNCPYFGCLARAWHEYVRNYNLLVRSIKDHSHLKPLPQEWYTFVNEMDRWRNIVPTMPFNTGPRDSVTASTADNYVLGNNAQQAVEVVAPVASTTAEGKIDIYTALGVEKEKADAGLTMVDLSLYTPAQQEVMRNGGVYDTTSVLDRRLVPLPKEEISITERIGLGHNRNNGPIDLFGTNTTTDIFGDTILGSITGGDSFSSGSVFDSIVNNGGKTGGTNTSFFS